MSDHLTNHPVLLKEVEAICRTAGAAILAIYDSDFVVRDKSDSSPVTAADEAAEALITAGLNQLTPDIPVVAEEAVSAGRMPDISQGRFWLVDPLDGTKEFISRNGEFTVNVALVENGVPVLGVVLAPALGRPHGRLYAGIQGQGAWAEDELGRRPIRCRAVPPQGWSVVASRSHGDATALDAFLAGRQVADLVNAGSSLKLCLVAAGQADLYPRLGRTMEWDIAAGDAVLRAAGGCVRRVDDHQPLQYGKAGLDNPHFYAAACLS